MAARVERATLMDMDGNVENVRIIIKRFLNPVALKIVSLRFFQVIQLIQQTMMNIPES